MTSSSVILKDILESESCELKQTIDKYINTELNSKLEEFKEKIKVKIDGVIDDRIGKFYNRSFEDHENTLFNENCNDYIGGKCMMTEYNNHVKNQCKDHPSNLRSYPLYPLSKDNSTKCFVIPYSLHNFFYLSRKCYCNFSSLYNQKII